MKTLVAALAGGAAADALWTDGIHIAGERFVVTKAEGRSIYGRKVRLSFQYILPTDITILQRRRTYRDQDEMDIS